MSGTGDQRANLVSDQGSYESYTVVTTSGSSDRASQGSYLGTAAAPARRSTAPDSTAVLDAVTDSTAVLSNAAFTGGHMPSSTPDWSALASQNERLVTAMPPAPAGGSSPASRPPASPAGRGGHRASRRGLWTRRATRGAVTSVAAIVATAGLAATSAIAATPQAPSWQIIKRIHGGSAGQVTAVVAAGRNSGWAFEGVLSPVAWKRSGATWTKVAFPATHGDAVIAAGASSAGNVWAFTGGPARSRAMRWNGSHWRAVHTFAKQVGGAAVISRSDVWVFGEPVAPGAGLGTWHYNGHSWKKVSSGHGLQGGSALSASSIWAFGGGTVAHWNGHTWKRTSVRGLLPAHTTLNDPAVMAIYARSKNSVFAVGNGNAEDDGGPLVVLHYNGHSWSKVAQASAARFAGSDVLGQVAPDGHGGLWIPVPGNSGADSHLVHYSGGHLSAAALPVTASKISVLAVAAIPHTSQALAAGFTHAAGNLGSKVTGVILQFRG